MFETLGSLFERKAVPRSSPLKAEARPTVPAPKRETAERKPSYSKVFRWRLPDPHAHVPASVEIAGTFTHWQKVPLTRDNAQDGWHATIHHIPGNKTHHYVLLLDGKPAFDKNADGMAIPHGAEEERYQLATEKGPRVMMLFAQTK